MIDSDCERTTRAADGRAIAAVSVAGPSYRFPARDIPRLARTVMEAALAIGHRMAGRSSF